MFVILQKRLKTLPNVVAIVVLALVYYGIAEISRHGASTPQSVTPVWPPDGFASAAVLIFGYQVLPGVLIGSFLANIWAFFDADSWYVAIASILQVLGIAIGTSIGSGVGSYLLKSTTKGRNPFKKLKDVYKFLFLTCSCAPMINATIGVLCLCLGNKIHWSDVGINWLTWWISNVAGICIFTPAILSFYEFYLRNIRRLKRVKKVFNNKHNHNYHYPRISLWKWIEAISLVTIVITLSFVSFYQEYNLEYMLIPCLVWAVLRFGQLGATSLIAVIAILAIVGTVKGMGTFASHGIYSLVLLQSFIVVIVVTTLSLLAILAEKQQAIANLQQSQIRLINQSMQLEESKSSLHKTALVLENQNIKLIEAKQLAESANRTKTEFLSNMSHELRTPLNAILGLTQLLQISNNIDNEEKSDIQIIYQSGKYLLNLIDDILDISKIESGKMELNPQDINLSGLLKDLVDIIQVKANQKNIVFSWSFANDLPQVVYTDAKRLRQIILNLLSNAVKFTNEGHVLFRVDFINSTLIKFEVEDSGIGIANNKLESIFLPFEQVGDSQFKNQGTGLGLAISQKIAEIMGGKINVTSQKGVGSIFQFVVNLQTSDFKVPSKQIMSIVRNQSVFDQNLAENLPLKILIAEDNIINQKVACKILDRLGYKADIAINGIRVLEALNQQTYDVILMDVQMPEMDGLEATKCIVKDKDKHQRPYIIAMTANSMDGDRERCLDAGMDDYISKPVNVNLLVDALMRSQCKL